MSSLSHIDGSAVQAVVNLQPGEAFSRSRFIPVHETETERILEARKNIRSYLSPVVARAKRQTSKAYSIYTTVSHTHNYDVVVTGVVVAEAGSEENDEDINHWIEI